MKKILLSVLGLTLFLSCQEKATNATDKTAEAPKEVDYIVYEEYNGTEPTKPEETELYKPVPPTVTPAKNNAAPSDAIVLFNGTNLDQWTNAEEEPAPWIVEKEGFFSVKDKSGDIKTKKEFGSIQLHIEWRSPSEVLRDGQNRANSGVFLQDRYEIQVLDNNNNDTYVNGQVGSIYKQHIPLAKASVPTGEWNTYDVVYHAPVFNEDGNKIKSGTITLLHNGILVLDHVEIKGTTPYIGWPKNEAHGKAPIRLQDHGDNSRVSYRNIWVREL
ncbi:DUF1080 domain-containing protein [Cellulophaga sp. 20_2_10]|uniref:3-keto-disaccharide hydrolase n=1 Tax=Cellulophaga sp. 20_2_10 TaxID=2942476 RepID=UPI00201B34A2|nr:DUF1080 domain-containing protein [Cellulophaga sp. 20_2_10]MCL5245591.1 DUF1080 domain-containing protein [Cellulophaga sp. 20_2_10]